MDLTVPESEKDPCLLLSGLNKSFAGLQALLDINMSFSQGERRAIIGTNGAGKTTLFNLISGELRPTSGQITYCGRNITNTPIHRRVALGIGRTFQITNLFPELSVLDNLLLASQAQEKTKFVMFRPQSSFGHLLEKSMQLLDAFDLSDKPTVLVKNLSYGDQRKLEVAMTLAGNPSLLLLDEPTAGLSPLETKELTVLLKNLDPKMTILLIEHDMDVAFEFCEHISVLHLGELLAEGTKNEIRNNERVQQIYFGGGQFKC